MLRERYKSWVFSLLLLWGKLSAYEPTVYSLDLPALPYGEVAFINGANYSPERACRCSSLLSELLGGYNVYTIYNPTAGLIRDVRRASRELYLHQPCPTIKILHDQWNAFFSRAEPDELYLLFCHSQGAIHTRHALMNYDHELRKRIQVIAIAPAAYIAGELCHSVAHYASRRDIVPHFDRAGRKNCRATVTFLSPHPEAPLYDHDFMSPTYKPHIFEHLKNYLKL